MATLHIDDDLVQTITDLSPILVEGRKHFGDGLQSVVLQALMRRGIPDPQTGALARSHLLDGALLRDALPEDDGDTAREFRVGVVAVDVRALAAINDALGMDAGERMLKTAADGLRAFCTDRPLVRLHGDAFAALYFPAIEAPLREETPLRVERALVDLASERLPELAEAGLSPGFTVAAVDLRIEQPYHWRVLGPLVWAEAERALDRVREGSAQGLQSRVLHLG